MYSGVHFCPPEDMNNVCCPHWDEQSRSPHRRAQHGDANANAVSPKVVHDVPGRRSRPSVRGVHDVGPRGVVQHRGGARPESQGVRGAVLLTRARCAPAATSGRRRPRRGRPRTAMTAPCPPLTSSGKGPAIPMSPAKWMGKEERGGRWPPRVGPRVVLLGRRRIQVPGAGRDGTARSLGGVRGRVARDLARRGPRGVQDWRPVGGSGRGARGRRPCRVRL